MPQIQRVGELLNGSERVDWHRLLGRMFLDVLSNSPYDVEVEYHTNQVDERLDLLIVRSRSDHFNRELPDGLEDLGEFNLFTFKSIHEPFGNEALGELIHHYYGLRKAFARREGQKQGTLPAQRFRCYAISARFPQALHSQKPLERIGEGIYREVCRDFEVKIIVTSQIPINPRNALWNLFSGNARTAVEGARNYTFQVPEMQSALILLLEAYNKEQIKMPYTIDEAQKEFVRGHVHWLSSEDRLKGLAAEDRLKGLPVEEIIAYLNRHGKASG